MKERVIPVQLLAYVLLLTILAISLVATSTAGGLTMRADLTHVDSGRGFTRWELLSRMSARSRARVASLHHRGGSYSGSSHPATAPVSPGTVAALGGTEFLIHFGIGTPRPQHVALTLDTGSDLVWTQCTPCPVCFDQPSPMYDPSVSGTSRPVPCFDPVCRGVGLDVSACDLKTSQCFYLASYGDNSTTAGVIVRDTFTFKAPDVKRAGGVTVAVANLAFGCGQYNTGLYGSHESGIAGFGRGRQSLPSQLKVGKFSYCLTSLFENKTSAVFLGAPDNLRAHATGPIRSTPIIVSHVIPSMYYLSFKGITVGETRLPVDESAFALKKDGTGGTIIDSGTSFTTFPEAVFDQLQIAFVAQVRLPVYREQNKTSDLAGKLCFSLSKEKVTVPKLVFHLAGADMELPEENYMVVVGGVMCLMVDGSDGDMTLIGNYQQQNMHIVYDGESNKLVFVPAQCDKL